MRSILSFLLVFIAAITAVRAAPSPVLGYDDARHLLSRTGFGPKPDEIARFAVMRRDEAAQALLDGLRTTAVTPPPDAMLQPATLRDPRTGVDATAADRQAFRLGQATYGDALRAWWLAEMLTTPSPLTERMTLFWHNHFVSSQQKVRLVSLLYRQNATLRSHAGGHFGALLHAIARDPAMVIYLDSAQNRRGAPNENFARELMELFTLGEGHYGEQDVKEAARAFTGWSVDRDTAQFRFRPALHDAGEKTVLGTTGRLDGDDVLDLLLARPETAEFITRKLWREFVAQEPDAAAVSRIAALFRDSGYDIKVALFEIFTADAFYADEHRGALVKSPADLVVGTLRQLDLLPADTRPFAVAMAGMGQKLFAAPNVKGWPANEAWINASSLLARKQFLDRLFRANDAPRDEAQAMRAANPRSPGAQFDPSRFYQSVAGDAGDRRAATLRFLLATGPQSVVAPAEGSVALVRAVVLDDAYELK